MLTWPCSIPGCTNRSTPRVGSCLTCCQHFCTIHNDSSFHENPEEHDPEYDHYPGITASADARQLEHLTGLLNSANLSAQADALRPGHTGTIVVPTSTRDYIGGGMNVILPVTFDDGVRWIARVRQKRFDEPPPAMRKMLVASEVASMRAMRENGLKVPNVYLPLTSDPNLDYYFLDFVPGSPATAPLTEHDRPSQLPRLIQDYALFQIALSKLTFSAIGSLYPCPSHPDGQPIIGPLCSRTICLDFEPWFLGPFGSNKERYLTMIEYTLQEIREERLFQQKAVLGYLAHLEIKDMVERYQEWDDGEGEGFYLKHADDKGDHIMINEQGGITGVIDWEWVYTTSKAEAFAAPCAFSSAAEYYQKGTTALSNLEEMLISEYVRLDRPDLAKCVRKGKKFQFLNDMVGEEPNRVLMDGLRECFGRKRMGFESEAEWEEWGRELYRHDMGLTELMEWFDKKER
ncbi:hypothetical protein IAR55_004070 [Kwoniella newhampshirensis]|uniref:Aminoglycoside phosphotransferase domain-containing protein n=1 Tax=Kwoniella newhampshirensis TaxID=1651941 RepID=A0AAW0YLM6_9TREE